MDGWKKFSETSLPEKEDFHSHLNLEDITDTDYGQKKRVCKENKQKIEEYHGFYIQNNSLLLADVLENF